MLIPLRAFLGFIYDPARWLSLKIADFLKIALVISSTMVGCKSFLTTSSALTPIVEIFLYRSR